MEPLRTGYEVRHGRSVKSSIVRRTPRGPGRVRMNDSKLTGDAAGIFWGNSFCRAAARRGRRSCVSGCLGFVAVRNSCGVSGGGTLPCLTSLCPAAVRRPRLAALCSAARRCNFISHLALSTIAEEPELISITISSPINGVIKLR